ncbi:ParA family protein [Zooshikella ganghwensis]|uniref:ParA family protein n=1 Tax=Zooshikella ganghwensis TaxID=202772 RepID=A0A4P9VFS9_9GAMM|nr:AAA family ATPase [Zooshikella ganghwensis]RDH41236.1 ParA family protein [Zooshikella ganghwensis]
MKIISLFNHKGGVSKTTTCFNLGWMLASKGYKTLIVDADPQCNLTALVLDYNDIEDKEQYYINNSGCDIYSGIESIINGELRAIEAAKPSITPNNNLNLLCGNIRLAEAETQMSVALKTSESIPAIRNIPGSLGELIKKTANEHNYEYILIDMSPSVGALNECLLMISDYFIIPASPDFFCAQAIKSLTSILPQWNSDITKFRDSTLQYAFPEEPPKFLGYIAQRYKLYSESPAKSFQRWINEIDTLVSNTLVPSLSNVNMTISEASFRDVLPDNSLYSLANIPDFNSLIAQSQKYNVPVFALTNDQIDQQGKVLINMQKNRENFNILFSTLANSIVNIVGLNKPER